MSEIHFLYYHSILFQTSVLDAIVRIFKAQSIISLVLYCWHHIVNFDKYIVPLVSLALLIFFQMKYCIVLLGANDGIAHPCFVSSFYRYVICQILIPLILTKTDNFCKTCFFRCQNFGQLRHAGERQYYRLRNVIMKIWLLNMKCYKDYCIVQKACALILSRTINAI